MLPLPLESLRHYKSFDGIFAVAALRFIAMPELRCHTLSLNIHVFSFTLRRYGA